MTEGSWRTNPHDPVECFYEGDRRGLTKREYFAARALAGVTAHGEYGKSVAKDAQIAVQYADALLQALNETR